MYHNYDYLGAPVIEQAVEAAQRGDSFARLRRRVNSMINISSSYLRTHVKERIGCVKTSIGKDVDEVLEFADPIDPIMEASCQNSGFKIRIYRIGHIQI